MHTSPHNRVTCPNIACTEDSVHSSLCGTSSLDEMHTSLHKYKNIFININITNNIVYVNVDFKWRVYREANVKLLMLI